MFSIIILGGENVPDYKIFQDKCIQFLRNKVNSGERIRILTIGDEYVEKFASTFGIEIKIFRCDWQKFGKNSLFIRNKELISEGNGILYFDSNKKDLDSLYDYATKSGLKNRRVEIDKLLNL